MKQLAALILMAAALTAPAWAQGPAVERVERGQLILENVPQTPPELRERLRQYVNTRGASFQGFTPDGGVLIATRFADATQIHAVAQPMAARRQLTFFAEPIAGAAVRPNGAGQFLFAKDQGGDENYQFFLFDPKSGRANAVTAPGTRNQDGAFSRDGRAIAWAEIRDSAPDYDILVADPADPDSRRKVLEGEGALGVLDWSPDARSILLSQYVSIQKSRLFTLELETGTLREITPELDVSYSGGAFLPDGRTILTTTDEGAEFARLALIDLETGARTILTADAGWDVEEFDLAEDGKRLAYTLNVGGASQLKLMDLRTRRALPAPDLPPGLVGGLDWDEAGERLGFTLNAATSPSDVYVYSIRGGELVRWTQSEIGGLDPATFVAPQLARFATFDSAAGGPKEITAWVYRPRGKGPHPAVVDIHGGPESQARPGFNSRIQYWVNELGLAVIVPNVRGSSGYGKTFVSLDNGLKRLDSVRDIGALLDWMQADGGFAMDKVAAYGGSYGGYMVYAAMIEYPQRFAAGIDIVGISDFRTFLENTSGYRRDLRRVEYGDERDPQIAAFFERIAPLRNADKIAKPMFVIHGQNDPRVPVSEAWQMVEQVRANGIETWVMVAKDEGHGFVKRPNQEAQREAETLFLAKTLNLD